MLSVGQADGICLDYVELHEANANSFGDNFAKLLLAVGSEIDVIAKAICADVAPNERASNILHYRDILKASFNGIHNASIDIMRTGDPLTPWDSWGQADARSPNWWRAYNDVKHDRVVNFDQATQRNALNALGGLLVLNMYYYRTVAHPEPYPQLLHSGFPDHLVLGSRKRMPGI
ncbi:hypothetical protein [Pararhizobium sp. LjRoot238]|uniref:hypothetical protein n=1 Tax=Pararhizobium sp. LjRoot238 TaxID=3342293 RepID=UPI003ED034F6